MRVAPGSQDSARSPVEVAIPSHLQVVLEVSPVLVVVVVSRLPIQTKYSSELFEFIRIWFLMTATDVDPPICRQFFQGFGGGGRSGGMRGMSGMFGDSDVDMEGFGGMPGAMPRTQQTRTRRPQSHPSSTPSSQAPSEIVRPLKVTLSELYSGTTKHLKVGRRLLGGGTEDKVLEIQVLPGWKSGTKVRFPRAGNEVPGGDSQDLVFVVEEKPHERFTRDGSDLRCTLKIPLVDALTNPTTGTKKMVVESLDGRKLQVSLPPGVVRPGSESVVSGQGMPIRKDGKIDRRGDLRVKWEVVFPDRLTDSQKDAIRKALS